MVKQLDTCCLYVHNMFLLLSCIQSERKRNICCCCYCRFLLYCCPSPFPLKSSLERNNRTVSTVTCTELYTLATCGEMVKYVIVGVFDPIDLVIPRCSFYWNFPAVVLRDFLACLITLLTMHGGRINMGIIQANLYLFQLTGISFYGFNVAVMYSIVFPSLKHDQRIWFHISFYVFVKHGVLLRHFG